MREITEAIVSLVLSAVLLRSLIRRRDAQQASVRIHVQGVTSLLVTGPGLAASRRKTAVVRNHDDGINFVDTFINSWAYALLVALSACLIYAVLNGAISLII